MVVPRRFTSLVTILVSWYACERVSFMAPSWYPEWSVVPLLFFAPLQHSNRWDPYTLTNIEYGDDMSVMGLGDWGELF